MPMAIRNAMDFFIVESLIKNCRDAPWHVSTMVSGIVMGVKITIPNIPIQQQER